MSVNFTVYDNPPEYGTHYVLDKAGEGIMMHSHKFPAEWHFTRVLVGAVHLYGDGLDTKISAPNEFHFPSYRFHELVALVDGTELLNILLLGKPQAMLAVDPKTLSGAWASQLMGPQNFVDW